MAALDAAVAAQAEWAATPPRDRGEILRRSFEAIIDQADDFAELISLEMGKTLAEAKGEVTYGAEFFRWFSEEAVRIHGPLDAGPGRWLAAADDPQAGRSRACSSRPGTSRSPWAPARSARRSPPAARWWSSPPS